MSKCKHCGRRMLTPTVFDTLWIVGYGSTLLCDPNEHASVVDIFFTKREAMKYQRDRPNSELTLIIMRRVG
mgnify:CR=1 FL=1